ncbi:MAG TPA: hypothetical protein VJ802_06225 [Gemmatimonadaceae bacterium]|nr:hypothetical protein [Gemmatimonadaceae bacterium]
MRRPVRDTEVHQQATARGTIIRDPLPTARALLWKPLPDSYHLLASMMRASEQQAVLFITQRAFLQVERHLRSAPDLELGGFLAGQLFECPRTHVRYSVINTVVPFADVSSNALLSRVTPESFDTVRKRLDAHQLSLIGWYRNGTGLGLQLLPDDVETHLTYFDQPWQTTMLVMPDPAKPKGAFFTYDSRVGRSYCIPFYELFDSPGLEKSNRLDRTCVSWTTYVAAEPVAPLPVAEKEVVEATVTPPRKPTPEPEPKEPIDEWWEAIKDPWVKLKDVATSATRREEVSSPVMESVRERVPVRPLKVEPIRPPAAPVREPRVHDDRAPIIPPAGNGVPRPARSQSAVAQPLPVERAPVVSPLSNPSAPPRERPPPPPRPTPPLIAPRNKRPAPPLAMPVANASNGPAVALPPDFHEEARRWQRRRRIGFAVAAVSFLSVIALSTLRSRTSGGPPPPAPAAAQPVSSAGLVAAMNGNAAPVELSLTAAVDSLSGALAYYRDIANDHRDGLVGCRVLDRAYALVGRARTRVDSARHQIAGSLADADSIRVSMLGAEYTFVTQTYRRSGCRA